MNSNSYLNEQSTTDILAKLPSIDEDANIRLHARLVTAAEAEGILDVAYRTIDTRIGTLLLAATDVGLVRVAFDHEGVDHVLANLASRISPRILHVPARLDIFARELDRYFAGTLRTFDVPLDLRLATGFRRRVLAHLREIDYGQTATYAKIAALSGSPRAVRAVGSACATNPLPLFVPCHRVIRSDGAIGAYAGGAAAKRVLLNLEAAA